MDATTAKTNNPQPTSYSKEAIRRIWENVFHRTDSRLRSESLKLLRTAFGGLSDAVQGAEGWEGERLPEDTVKRMRSDSSPLLTLRGKEPVIMPIMVSGMALGAYTAATLDDFGIGHGGPVLVGFHQHGEFEGSKLKPDSFYATREGESYLLQSKSEGKPVLVVDDYCFSYRTISIVEGYLLRLGFNDIYTMYPGDNALPLAFSKVSAGYWRPRLLPLIAETPIIYDQSQ